MNYDINTPSDLTVIALLEAICVATGVEYQLLQPGIEIKNTSDIQKVLKPHLYQAQIIHSLVFENNLFTIILPPDWDSTKQYPLLMLGSYGLNDNFVAENGADIFNILGSLYQHNRQGAIGIIWNGGGAVAARTVNTKAYTDLNRLMGLVIPELGIAPSQVVTMGNSRGGTTALNMASHPEITQFKVRYACVGNPYNDLSLVASLAGPTLPNLMYAMDWSVGYRGAWDIKFRYPITNLNVQDALMNILTGTTDEAVLHTTYNLDSPIKLKNLKDRGTEILLEMGSHDVVIPMVDKVNLLHAYLSAGIPVEAHINYLMGHTVVMNYVDLVYSALKNISNEMLYNYPRQPLIMEGKIESILLESPESITVLDNVENKIPLSLEFPRYVNENVNSFIIGIGTPHARYSMVVKCEGRELAILFELDDSGSWISKIDPSTMPAGRYELVRVEDLGNNSRPINTLRSALPMNETIIVDRVVGDIYQYGSQIGDVIKQGYNGYNGEYTLRFKNSFLAVNYGIVEI